MVPDRDRMTIHVLHLTDRHKVLFDQRSILVTYLLTSASNDGSKHPRVDESWKPYLTCTEAWVVL